MTSSSTTELVRDFLKIYIENRYRDLDDRVKKLEGDLADHKHEPKIWGAGHAFVKRRLFG